MTARTNRRPWRLWPAMLAILCLLALAALPAVAQAAPQAETNAPASPVVTGKRAVARGSGAVLRAQPNGQGLQKLPLATALRATARTGDSQWLQVTLKDGAAGWVHIDEIVIFGVKWLPVSDAEVLAGTPDDSAVAEAPPENDESDSGSTAGDEPVAAAAPADEIAISGTVDAAGRRLNVRGGPGTNYAVVGSLASGEAVTAVGRNENNSWVQIQLAEGEDVAWVSARYLDLPADPGDLPLSEQLSQTRPIRTAGTSVGATALTGKLVLQQRSGGPIVLIDLRSGSTRQLTTGLDPALSPDGQTVAFVRDDAAPGIYLIDVDGGNERRIFTQDKLRAPAWSPDGNYIAFSRVVGQGACRDVGFGLCVPDNPFLAAYPLVTRDQRGLTRIDTQGGSFLDIASSVGASAPDWGANGIVYQSAGGLQISSLDGDGDTRVVSGEYRFQDPNWHPSINRIVFQSLEKDHREIFIINDDGSGLTALTRPASLFAAAPQNVAPVWSPDGKTILFLSNRSGDWALWAMNADGGNQRRLNIDLPIEYNYNAEQVFSWGQ